MKLPKQITMKQFLHVQERSDGNPSFMLFFSDYTGRPGFEDWACLGLVEFTVDVPHIDPIAKLIEGLERQIEAERVGSQQRINILLDRLSKLQCLEHKPEGEA